MRLNLDPRLPAGNDIQGIKTRLYDVFKEIAVQVNNLSEGRLAARYSSLTASPTTGTWARGDVVFNSEPSELGTAGSKYVITHWICTVSGTPGTWVQCRSLTGN